MVRFFAITLRQNMKSLENQANKLVVANRNINADAQQFYDDVRTGTIRSKVNDYCLVLRNDQMLLEPYQFGQLGLNQWERDAKGAIRNRVIKDFVFDLPAPDTNGSKVYQWKEHGGGNQRFSFEQSVPAGPGESYGVTVSCNYGLAWEVVDASTAIDAKIKMAPRDINKDRQQFYDDPATGTIRSKLSDLCIQVDGDNVTVDEFRLRPYEKGNVNQQWKRLPDDTIIRNPSTQKVIDYPVGDAYGMRVYCYNYHGGSNQRYLTEVPLPSRPRMGRLYYSIVVRKNNLALEVEDSSRAPGAKIKMMNWDIKKDAQLFYDDLDTCTIRSKLNDFCIQVDGGNLAVDELRLMPYADGNKFQQWYRDDDAFIRNRCLTNMVLDVPYDLNSKVYMFPAHGGNYQRFDYPLATTQPEPPTNPGIEFYYALIGREGGLAIDVEGADVREGAVLKLANKNTSQDRQLFYDHIATGTIRSKLNDFCITIFGSATTTNPAVDRLKLMPFKLGDANQLWYRDDKARIRSRFNNTQRAFDMPTPSVVGSIVYQFNAHDGGNQQWNLEMSSIVPNPLFNPDYQSATGDDSGYWRSSWSMRTVEIIAV